MLNALAAMDQWRDSQACRTGTETLLRLWSQSLSDHPYIFYMGTDFRNRGPFIWYDLLQCWKFTTSWVRDVIPVILNAFAASGKTRFEGHFTLESVWLAWKDWEFGQKKIPSRWLTLLSIRVLQKQNRM